MPLTHFKPKVLDGTSFPVVVNEEIADVHMALTVVESHLVEALLATESFHYTTQKPAGATPIPTTPKKQPVATGACSRAEVEEHACAIAHDLREPLRTISTFTELLARQVELDPNGKRLAQLIVTGVERINAFVDGLLTLTVEGFDGPSQLVDLNAVVADALQNLGHAITTNQADIFVGTLPKVHGNPQLLTRVFQNLIANAIKYRSDTPVKIGVSASREGPIWIVKVRDNGIGIDPAYHADVFGLLKRLHGREIAGAGIGLATCKKIVEGQGGTIWVKSENGKGSTFCFTIAAQEAGAAPAHFRTAGLN